jgi:hypothetical protein
VTLVSGEAGIGKTTLVSTALAALSARARALRGACDDLIAPRSFGPLQDAARGTSGPLAAAVAAGADRTRPSAVPAPSPASRGGRARRRGETSPGCPSASRRWSRSWRRG